MLVHCIRHGESTYNAEGRIQGQGDVPLSELGLQQGAALAAAVADWEIDAIYASPLQRAMQTAGPMAEALGLSIHTDRRLVEVHAGEFQHKLRTDLERDYPDVMARWRAGDPDFALPGGETRRELMRRGQEVFEEIARKDHQQVLVVAHGGLLLASLKALLGVPAERHPFVLHNGSISAIEMGNGETKLHSLNRIDHLTNVGYGGRGDL